MSIEGGGILEGWEREITVGNMEALRVTLRGGAVTMWTCGDSFMYKEQPIGTWQ
jgi:hypothetical protein